jgi:hypothetical protein
MLRLPVSGLQVIIRQPTGAEDVFLQEMRGANAAVALELIGRLVRTADGAPVDWREISVSDLETLLLVLRQATVGDLISTEVRCPAAGCEARVDVAFRIGEFLASRKANRPQRVKDLGDGKWFAVKHDGDGVEFRLPTGGDLLAIDGHPAPYRELGQRCIRPAGLTSASWRRAESAMEALAPRFSSILTGECPECGIAFECYFDALLFVLRELRSHAAGVYQDVHLLALHYKWPEQEILALPRNRRTAYVEMLGGGGVAA